MSRVPIRVRVTLVFAVVMALVLGATGLFLYVRLGDQLDESIDNGLRTTRRRGRAHSLRLRSGARRLPGRSSDRVRGELRPGAQRGRRRRRFDSAARGPGRPHRGRARPGTRGAAVLRGESLPGIEGRARLLATPVKTDEDEDRSSRWWARPSMTGVKRSPASPPSS